MKVVKSLLFVVMLMISCTGKKQANNTEESKSLTFDSIVAEEIIKLFPEKSDSLPCATLNISFVFPANYGSKEELQKLQTVFNEKVLGEDYVKAASPQEVINNYITQYADFYRKDLVEMYEDELDEMLVVNPNALSYGRDLKNKITFVNENLVSFTVFNWEYTGGAHGYASQFNYSINLKTFKPITLDEIMNSDYHESLKQIVKNKLLRVMAVKTKDFRDYVISDDELKTFFFDFDKIEVNDNFILTETGIFFTYNPYDIAAYASGLFKVEIPYAEITHLLNVELFEKFFPNTKLNK